MIVKQDRFDCRQGKYGKSFGIIYCSRFIFCMCQISDDVLFSTADADVVGGLLACEYDCVRAAGRRNTYGVLIVFFYFRTRIRVMLVLHPERCTSGWCTARNRTRSRGMQTNLGSICTVRARHWPGVSSGLSGWTVRYLKHFMCVVHWFTTGSESY